MTTERRFLNRCEAVPALKVEKRDDGKRVVVGYGAVFHRAGHPGTEYRLWDNVKERVMPGAFDRALLEDDVRGLHNHDTNRLLGRTKSGTMRLSVDQIGLRYEIDLPDTPTGNEVGTAIERGDMSGSSFSFAQRKVMWAQDGDDEVRELHDVALFDVGPVVFPAYEATTADLRSAGMDIESLKLELRAAQDARKPSVISRGAVIARARVVEIATQ